MSSRAMSLILIVIFVTCLGIWAGCTRESTMIMSQPSIASQQASSYFPISAGKVSTYAISNSGGGSSILTIRMGSRVRLGADSAWQWIAVRPDNSFDTDYVVLTANSVVLYETAKSAPEVILLAPLQKGQSWSRFPLSSVASDSTASDTTTLATDFTGGIVTKANDYGGNGNGNGKVVPLAGGARASVDGIEELVLSSGTHYAETVRIKTENAGGTANYYWFAPSYGLVKYVLGATPTQSNGSQMGELLY